MRAQTFANAEEATWMHAKKTMEINPFHPIVKELLTKSAASPDDAQIVDLANLMYDTALLQSGFSMKDPTEFASRIHRVLAAGLNVDPEAVAEQEPEGDEPDEEPAHEASQDNEPEIQLETEGTEEHSHSHDEL